MPLTTGLRASLLACACPLKVRPRVTLPVHVSQRLLDATDVMRLLLSPSSVHVDGSPNNGWFAHRFRLIPDRRETRRWRRRYVASEALPRHATWMPESTAPIING